MKFDPAMSPNEHFKHAKDGLAVWDDIFRYATLPFSAIEETDFARMRWFGIYQQKPNDGHFMWRIKLPGGRVSAAQLRVLGELADKFGRGIFDITTRQDIQLHWLTMPDFPELFDRVYRDAGLYTEFSCGDTPRNVCSCPLGELIPHQIVPLGTLVQDVSDMFRAAGRELSNLPRKFKTTISGCPLHCHQPQINDIGAFGVLHDDGRRGLGVMVGGGLSSTPHFAQGLRVFVPHDRIAAEIPAIFKAIALIFRDADELRYKRKRARLKFLVADHGWQWFRDQLQARLDFPLEHAPDIVNPRGALHTDHMGEGPLNNGLRYLGVAVPRGRLRGFQAIAIAKLVERFAPGGGGEVRFSQKQNLLLVNIPPANIAPLTAELVALGLPPGHRPWGESLVACTGTQFCNLAVTETKERARDILRHLEATVALDSPIMVSVSGCPNACAQYQIADIGLTGTKAIWNGQKVDAFDVLVGGRLGDNPEFGLDIAEKVPSAVVHRVIEQVARAYMTHRIVDVSTGEPETFGEFAGRVDHDAWKPWAVIPEWTPPPKRVREPATT